jgi:hypothetical protein
VTRRGGAWLDAATQDKAGSNGVQKKLAGKGPDVKGAVLADLLSVWLAGHHPDLRDELLHFHIDRVKQLVPLSEREIFGHEGHPGRY